MFRQATAGSGNAARATLQESDIRDLRSTGAITGFVARGQNGGFLVEVVLRADGGRVAILSNSRGGSRVFASLETIAMLLKRLGFDHFCVDAATYVQGRVRAARPDRALAMKAVKLPATAKPRPAASNEPT